MEEQQMSLNTEKTLSKPIEINLTRLRMRDYETMNTMKGSNIEMMMKLIPIIGRISNYSEEELWDMEIETFGNVQNAFFEAMDNIVKKATAGNSPSS